jgi:hypothetical protein
VTSTPGTVRACAADNAHKPSARGRTASSWVAKHRDYVIVSWASAFDVGAASELDFAALRVNPESFFDIPTEPTPATDERDQGVRRSRREGSLGDLLGIDAVEPDGLIVTETGRYVRVIACESRIGRRSTTSAPSSKPQ